MDIRLAAEVDVARRDLAAVGTREDNEEDIAVGRAVGMVGDD